MSELNIDRRTFVKRSAQLTAAVSMTSALACSAQDGKKSLGIAVVGLGVYGGMVGKALQVTTNCHLAGIVSGTPSKISKWKEDYGIDNAYDYESFDLIAKDDSIDAVYICLPNSMHRAYTERAAAAGKHVICEKPMATNVTDAEAMIAACKKAGKTLSIGYRCQYEPNNLEVVKRCREETHGKIEYIEAAFGFRSGNPDQWRLKKDMAGGGAMMDVGIYCLQGAIYSMGINPIAVTAQEFKTQPEKFAEVDETITFQLEFPNHVVANCTTSYAIRVEKLHIFGSKGKFGLGPAFGYGSLEGFDPDGIFEMNAPNQQAKQLDDMSVDILKNNACKTPGEMGLRDMKIIEAIYQSISEGGKRMTLNLA